MTLLTGVDTSERQKLLRQQAVLASFRELALRSDSLDEILTEACRLVAKALGTDLAMVMELQPDGTALLVRAGLGWKSGVVGVTTVAVADDTSEALAINTGMPVISPDIATETRFRYAPFLHENGVRAAANVRIIGPEDGRPFGILQIDSREPRRFTGDDTTFLTGYANLLAAAVDRLRIARGSWDREAQLRRSQQLEAVGRLAAGVAHDFNNILQSISGGLELVLEEVGEATAAHEFAVLALGSTKRGADLTHHLLSYARKLILHPWQLDVTPFLAEMRQMLSRTLPPQITVKVRADEDLPRIHVDAGALQTALFNLATNAAHAMPSGGTLLLDARAMGRDAKHVVIAATDTGVGMDEATRAQAFEPFFTTKCHDGSGLGLSMVQGFAEQSGGEASIESAPGKGTTVTLRLPVAASGHDTDAQGKGRVPARRLGSGRILLVDDEAFVLMTTGVLLERAGFQTVRAGNGDQALAVLASGERFDALVSDYAMPGMNGVELIKRACAVQPGLTALITTGLAETAIAAALPGSITVLRKPFQQWQLIEALRSALRSAMGQHANAIPNAMPTGG